MIIETLKWHVFYIEYLVLICIMLKSYQCQNFILLIL